MMTADQAYTSLCAVLAHPSATSRDFSPEEWNLLADTARREGVAPLLHYSLSTGGRLEGVPDDIRQSLLDAYHDTGVANMLLYHELSQIVEALREDGDPPLVLLKGPALAETIYPNIALRPFGDLDLLLPEERLSRAVRSLKALGYHEPFTDVADGLNVLVGHHVHLVRTNSGPATTVELHWSLIGGRHDRRTPSVPWFWEQAEPVQFSSDAASVPQTVLILNPTAHLLYLCAHLMLQHGEADYLLRWFYDIHLLIEKKGACIDWDQVAVRGREFGWGLVVGNALQAVRERFQTQIPLGVLDRLSRVGFDRTSQLDVRRAEVIKTRATSVSSPAARLRFLLGSAFPSPAYLRWRYRPRPTWLWPLFYVCRWWSYVREPVVTLRKLVSLCWPERG